jgi:FixJ family two-component response regulator
MHGVRHAGGECPLNNHHGINETHNGALKPEKEGAVMEVLILDDLKSRKTKLVEMLEKRRYKVVQCSTSNDFLSAVNHSLPGLILLDFGTWHRGRSINGYFQTGKKIEHVPVVFYNTPPNFVALSDRNRNEKDYVLQKPPEVDSVDVDSVIDAVSHSL